MDTETPPLPPLADPTPAAIISLAGICETVHLPRPPNFLRVARADGAIPIGQLTKQDLDALGWAMQRQLREHWHRRAAAALGLSEAEAVLLSVPTMLTPEFLDRVSCAAFPNERWGEAYGPAGSRPFTQAIIHAYHQELLR